MEPVGGAFSHPAYFYRDDTECLDSTLAFVRDGLAAGERVAVAVPGERLAQLHNALGPAADGVHFTDMARAGRNPGRIISGVLAAFADAQPDGPVRIVAEPVWPGRTPLEYPACVQHEALVNSAFDGRRATILCLYDATRLPPQALGDACVTHPVLIEGGRRRASAHYAPERAVASYNVPLAEPRFAASFPFDDDGLRAARQFAVRAADELGLTGRRLDDLALAVAELTTNSVLHGGGSGVVRVWAENGHVAFEVRDAGRLADPLAGSRTPPPGRPGGRGLLMVHQIADLVRTHTSAAGTAIRCYLTLNPPATA
ncbi:putative regulator of sigma factor [Actinacidiphila reveromycinica]|uniref:Putative regulator of sigma factor n=1 Tax=Actinacidiphila reveromycinica TaxID=659352 RepID=A0A7U3UNN6_9ACTN|nr:sensor histidine kinase [Streptomyces sp. SN-593]BBA95866.1 putative regulator of sigma factor [Streptomyces sp. SN-593]